MPPSVLQAISTPTIGHLDPAFLTVMDAIRTMLGDVLRTRNTLTLPMSGTGSAGMEACIANLVEPGDRVLVGINGVFGSRIANVAARYGAEVRVVEGEWGRALDPDALLGAAKGQRFDLVCVVHAETSTGVLQPIPPIRDLADRLGALLVVDAVTSVGGVDVATDEWRVDALYTGTQKCLSCPPGLSPVSLSERARAKLEGRRSPVSSWYLDLSMIKDYWGAERAYHHTAPVNLLFGLHEALRLVLEETLVARFDRHRRNSRALVSGLAALGLEARVPQGERLPQLITVSVPATVEDASVRRELLSRFGLEIGGGLGPMKGTIWRIGLMGASCTEKNVLMCLAGLEAVLRDAGHTPLGSPVDAAREAWKFA